MALLTVTPITALGITPTLVAAAAGGDTVPTGTRTFFAVKNGSGASITVTCVTTQEVSGLGVADAVVTVAAAGEKWIGPFPASLFADSSGYVAITYSAAASVTVGAFSI